MLPRRLNNMDFGYITYSLLLFLPSLCLGQDGGVKFEVKIKPALEEELINLSENKVITCVASATADDVTLSWFFGDTEITSESDRVRLERRSDTMVMLRIDSVTDDDGGDYKCMGTSAGQTAEATIKLVVVLPLTVNSPTEQFDVIGKEGEEKDGEVHCSVTSKPPPLVTWKFHNNSKIQSGDKYTIKDDKLIIKNLKLEDSMTYVCDIVVIDTGESKSLKIDFTAVQVPTIPMPPSIQPDNPKVGVEVKITCEAMGEPAPTYQFKRGEVIVDDALVDNGVLTIPSLTIQNEAEYTCIATNKGGSAESTSYLDVKIPPVIKDDLELVYDAVESQPLEIACTAEGDPEPSVKWEKQGEDDGALEVGPEFEKQDNSEGGAEIKIITQKMIFREVSYQNAGTYKCNAFNLVGNVSKTVKVTVQYKPNFDTDFIQEEFYGWRGHQVNLTCLVNANPVALVNWYLPSADEPEKHDAATRILNEAPYTIATLQRWDDLLLSSSSLLVEIGDDSSVYRDYLCEATNLQGQAWRKVTIIEAKPPGPPVVEQNTVLSSRMILNIKTPVNEGGQSVSSYSYEYYKDGDQANKKTGTADLTGPVTQITLSDLEPDMSYVVKVKAVNVVNPGQEQTIVIKTAKKSKPEKPEIQSSHESDRPDSYLLKWEPHGTGGSPIKQYIVTYRKVKIENEEEEDPSKWLEMIQNIENESDQELIVDSAKKEVRLDNLKIGAYYEVRIQTENELGLSLPDRKVIKTSAVGSSSASAGPGAMIGVVIGLLVLVVIIVLIIVFVVKKKPQVVERLRGRKGGEEGQGAETGKDPAEEEKLIKEDTVKVENEVDNKTNDAIEEKPEEFEPDTKPEALAEPEVTSPADGKPAELAPVSATEIKITPETPEKGDETAA